LSKESAFEVGRLYAPIKAIADTLVASQKDVFVRLPALVGYWPMGMRAAGTVTDHTGNGFTLTQTGTNPVGYDGNSFSHLGNGTNYVSNSSAQLGLSGLETWVSSSIRGLTIGGWFMVDSLPASQGGLAGKFGVITDYGYALVVLASGAIQTIISANGSNVFSVSSPVAPTGQWIFLAGRFIPSTELAVFVDADKSVNTTAIPASINFSSQDFEVGRFANSNPFIAHTKARDVFICASALSDALIEEIRVTSTP